MSKGKVKDKPAGGYGSLRLMAEASVEGVQKKTNYQVDPRLIVIRDGHNLRSHDTRRFRQHIDEMKAAFLQGAKFPPIDVVTRDGVIYVVDGFCRTTFYQELIAEGHQIERVDVQPFHGDEKEEIKHMLRSARGEPLTPLEQSEGVGRLMAQGVTDRKEIAAEISRSETYVARLQALNAAPHELKELVKNEVLPAKIVIEMVMEFGPEEAFKKLKGHIKNAEMTGKKVTEKSIKGRNIPRKITKNIVETLDSVVDGLPVEVKVKVIEVEGLGDMADKNETIAIPIDLLIKVIGARKLLTDFREKAAEREKILDEKKSQTDIFGDQA